MDPLTAFGLASNVLSFVSFTSKLIKTSVEVYRSGSDHPAAALCVEQVYSDLTDLNNRLILTCEHSITDEDAVPKVPVDEAKNSAIAVKRLAATCRRDCDELLRVTERLQLKHGGSSRRKWESFRIALRKLWTQKAIDDIEDRLLKTQVTLTFHICNLTALNEALRRITENNADYEVNFCLFIDGLDEFEGDHHDHFQLCQTMCKLSASRHIKICLSSRPWNVFKEAFESMPKIYIHDLTQNDIRRYATSRLRAHPQWADICASTPLGGEWFIKEIADRCSGVFLWAFLVTNLLREGMTNRDQFPDLRRRLESFPRELGDFFKQILDSVEPLYHAKMATMLHIALAAKVPLHMVIYDYHDLEHDDEDYWRQSPMLPLSLDEYEKIYSRMTYHLNSRTRGLLELQSFHVHFLHRTVKDYLSTQPLSGILRQKIPQYLGRKFIPELSILRAYAALVKRTTPEVVIRNSWASYSSPANGSILDDIPPGIPVLTRHLMPYAAQLDSQRPRDSRLDYILDGMDSSIQCMLSKARMSAKATIHRAWNTKLFFRENLIEWGVCNYVFGKEMEDPVCSSKTQEAEFYRKRMKAAIEKAQTKQTRFNGSGTVILRVSPLKKGMTGGSSYISGGKRVRPKDMTDSQVRLSKKR
ncbi:hypothetical protein Daus18300_006363 [Diaporthe australafricana]|uniref:DUF7791 domain-containing protein n=1 Tax=Diaporthe australafricana TaxID=127596 RepID=A0ABR3WV21_9PEZI